MNETTIPAQVLYDLRETYAFTDGKTLSAFFARETGDPSPSGKWRVDATAAFEFVEASAPAECFEETMALVVREMWEYLLLSKEVI